MSRRLDYFSEVLNGKLVNPLDERLALPDTLKLLHTLQKQEDTQSTLSWQDSVNVDDIYEIMNQNGILMKVHSRIARALVRQPKDYHIRQRAAGMLFNEIAYNSQKSKLPQNLTLLSGIRTLALFNKLYPNAIVNSSDAQELAGLVIPTEDNEGANNDKIRGISVTDAIALKEEESGVFKVAEIHEYSISRLPGRSFKKYSAYRNYHSPIYPDFLPPDATFVFVSLTGRNNPTTIIENMVKEHIPDPRMRIEKLALTYQGFKELVSKFVSSYKPHYRASPLTVIQKKALL